MSQLFGTSLRATSANAESDGHQLLVRGAFIRQVGQGIFAYMPLGLRVMRRLEAIMREEMEAVGGVEVSLPVVQPAELWRETGRFEAIGPELVRLKDRRDRELVLALTHEEVVAFLAASEISSWRQLPKLVYQIQIKFRDDPRPRAGLIRTREFTMKDAYSLDADEDGLALQYQRQYDAYFKIFQRCQLPAIAVVSDVGMMGGSGAHEFMYLTPIGEDTLVLCDHCSYAENRQVATFQKPDPAPEEVRPIERVSTPGATTIDMLAAQLDIAPAHTAKVVFLAATLPGHDAATMVVAVVRGDMTLNETKLAHAIGAGELRPMTTDEISEIGCVAGYASPIGVAAGTLVVVDDLVARTPNLVAGANESDWHLRNVNVGRDFTPDIEADIVAADDGDLCPDCGAALRTARGVEIGNIFKLGTKYAAALGATYLGEDGVEHPIVMGSYGIGVGRLLACIAEEHHDDAGLVWPTSVAPFDVHICSLGTDATAAALELYAELVAHGLDVVLDDRGERAGVQFADADLIGAPVRLTVSRRTIDAGGVEAKLRRSAEAVLVPRGEISTWVMSALSDTGDAGAATE